MKHWINTYPHTIYANVLMLDGKIIDYSIGEHCWNSINDITLRGQVTLDELMKCNIKHKSWEANTQIEHSNIMSYDAPGWINSLM